LEILQKLYIFRSRKCRKKDILLEELTRSLTKKLFAYRRKIDSLNHFLFKKGEEYERYNVERSDLVRAVSAG
jgi:hypothetical protein